MPRVRSPNYPAISLPKALDFTKKIYEANHTHRAEPLTVAQAIGYSTLNGGSKSALSALKKYGLLIEETDNQLRISPNALTILVDPPDSAARAKAIVDAAFLPVLFADFRKEYGSSVPNDGIIRAFLLKRGFAPNMVEVPIKSYRETMDLVEEVLPSLENEGGSDAATSVDPQHRSTAQSTSAAGGDAQAKPTNMHFIESLRSPPVAGEVEWVRGLLGADTTYRILVTGKIGPKEIDRLIKLIQAQKSVYDDDVDLNAAGKGLTA